MRKVTLLSVAVFAIGLFCLFLPSVSAQNNPAVARVAIETLNNDGIVQMVNSGLSDTIIVAKIKNSNASFDTSAAALKLLKSQGVSDTVILAMVQKASGMDVSTGDSTPAPTAGVSGNFTIPDGTEVKVVTIEEISGQKAKEGDPLTFKVAEDVKINNVTVIAKDTVVKGIVSSAKKKGLMGRSGELSVRIESAQTVDGQKIKLRASKSGEGGNNTGSTVALTVLFGPVGLLRHGKEAKLPAGSVLTAYTDEAKAVVVP